MSERVHAVIVNYNSGELLGQCLDALGASTIEPRVTVVDNASGDDSLDCLSRIPADRRPRLVSLPRNLGFATGVNAGLHDAPEAAWTLLLNPDCLLEHNALALLTEALQEDPGAAAAGPLITNPDGTEQRGCRRRLPDLGSAWRRFLGGGNAGGDFNLTGTPLPDGPAPVPALSGACMLVRTDVLLDAGGLDEGYFLHFEDLDLCSTLGRRGWRLLFVPAARALHWQGTGSSSAPLRVLYHKHRGMYRYTRRHVIGGGRIWLRPVLASLITLRFLMLAALTAAGRAGRRDAA